MTNDKTRMPSEYQLEIVQRFLGSKTRACMKVHSISRNKANKYVVPIYRRHSAREFPYIAFEEHKRYQENKRSRENKKTEENEERGRTKERSVSRCEPTIITTTPETEAEDTSDEYQDDTSKTHFAQITGFQTNDPFSQLLSPPQSPPDSQEHQGIAPKNVQLPQQTITITSPPASPPLPALPSPPPSSPRSQHNQDIPLNNCPISNQPINITSPPVSSPLPPTPPSPTLASLGTLTRRFERQFLSRSRKGSEDIRTRHLELQHGYTVRENRRLNSIIDFYNRKDNKVATQDALNGLRAQVETLQGEIDVLVSQAAQKAAQDREVAEKRKRENEQDEQNEAKDSDSGKSADTKTSNHNDYGKDDSLQPPNDDKDTKFSDKEQVQDLSPPTEEIDTETIDTEEIDISIEVTRPNSHPLNTVQVKTRIRDLNNGRAEVQVMRRSTIIEQHVNSNAALGLWVHTVVEVGAETTVVMTTVMSHGVVVAHIRSEDEEGVGMEIRLIDRQLVVVSTIRGRRDVICALSRQ
jgi:hypothetical protein